MAEAMTPYDLVIYALKAFTMADYLDKDPGLALNNSFKPADDIVVNTLKLELENNKCINHTFKDADSSDVFCFKNYVPLNITIIPYSKVKLDEKYEIISNIYRALTQAFNASKVEFGEELNYDEVVNVIVNADSRIKNIRLEDFEYIPTAMLPNGEEKPVYEYSELLVDMIAKNVLAGRLCLFNFDDTFNYSYGQINSDVYPDVVTISTEAEIVVPENGPSGAVIDGDTIVTQETTTFENVVELKLKLYDNDTHQDIDDPVPASIGITIEPGQSYVLQEGWHVIVSYEDPYSSSQENLLSPPNGANNVKTYIYNSSTSTYSYDPDATITPGDIKIMEETAQQSSESESIDFQYDIKENEYIEVTYPNYYSSVIYPTYCNYRFEITSVDDKKCVPANTDYKLQGNEMLYIMYTNNNETKKVTYGPGTIINTTFDMYKTTTGSTKQWSPNQKLIFTTLGAGQQISIREKLETRLSGINTPVYWIRNNNSNILFKQADSEHIGKEGYSWVILESGEYFIYSDSNLDSMVILGAGTKIERSTNDTTQWGISTNSTTIESISQNGFSSDISWQYKDFSVNNLLIKELNIVTLGNGDQISVAGWNGKPDTINNKWKTCDGTIYYRIGNGSQIALRKLNLDEGYLIRSRLDLVTDNYTGQKLLSDENHTQRIMLQYFDSSTDDVVLEPSYDSESSEGQAAELYVQTSIPLDLIGGESMNISLITAENILNFMTYSDDAPMKYNTSNSWTVIEESKPIVNDNGKYIINIDSEGYADFPISYEKSFGTYLENDRDYILPVFVNGEDLGDSIKAEFIVPSNQPIFDSESTYSNITGDVDILDYNITNKASSMTLSEKAMYLLTPIVDSGIVYPSSESDEPTPDEVVNIKGNLVLRIKWKDPESSIEIVTVYDPKVISGVSSGIAEVSSVVQLQDVLDRIDYLVSTSTKPTIKPYYINEPEQSIAIQDPDTSNPNIFWDKNNVANLITIPQIIIPSDNIDIIKSMKGYTLSEEKKDSRYKI